MSYLANHTVRSAVAACLAILLLPTCGDTAAHEDLEGDGSDLRPLVFSAVPHQQAAMLQHLFQPLLDMLRDETGREITFAPAANYAAVIDAVVAGEVDIAELGPFSYVLAEQQGARATPVVAGVHHEGQPPGYWSYGIVRAGSGIDELADFSGETICFTDRNSASGYLYPSAALLELGIDPAEDVVPQFVGSHDAAVLAVARGECDAGFAADAIVDRRLIEQGQIESGEVTRVWRSEIITGGPLVVSDNLPAILRQKLTDALLHKSSSDYLREHGYCTEECVIDDGAAYGFIQIEDQDYDSIREVCRIARHASCLEG